MFAASGLLAGHELAHRLTGDGGLGVHGYLRHAPQVLLVLALPAVLLAAFETRGRPPRPWSFALLGVGGYVAMEHLERLATGAPPWVLTTPTFVLGLLLQLPFALAAWWVARSLLRLEPPRRLRPPRLQAAFPVPAVPAGLAVLRPAAVRPRLRAPPLS